jgi:hypothetical protein
MILIWNLGAIGHVPIVLSSAISTDALRDSLSTESTIATLLQDIDKRQTSSLIFASMSIANEHSMAPRVGSLEKIH